MTSPDKPMTDRKYQVGRWYPWTGGSGCPVPNGATVTAKCASGNTVFAERPAKLHWKHQIWLDNIIAFRVDSYPEEAEAVARHKAVMMVGDTPKESTDQFFTGNQFITGTVERRDGKFLPETFKAEDDQ